MTDIDKELGTPWKWESAVKATTKELVRNFAFLSGGDGYVFMTESHDIDPVKARYVTAAVNATARLNLSAAALESGALAKLVEAARMVVDAVDRCTMYGPADSAREKMRFLADALTPFAETTDDR